ncbi:hypothetical protein MON38_16295 [Hymenobacter sp. DH14]|uniref:Auto-transporter adhesin head GIN domain-containing protein n=1 Tax=Hymenobacter cyanobacteriorum TaxID=2926463 RepID=A0A9X1VGW8_9BACT|nr:hypothetical protein [Hymenobacter cyanobacteriorum]MCI1188984.1 hypothetical protein [Hymenobacter cyanobacteriorum]
MKTSNKLFVAAVALVLGSLATYDAALRAEYRTGRYKDPLRNYQALGLRNFDAVRVPAAGVMNVKIVAGPFAVHVDKDAAEFVHVTQHGGQLSVALDYPKEWKWLGPRDAVRISCPRLSALTADGSYTVGGKPQLDQLHGGGEVTVQGFRQDSLTVRQEKSNAVLLTGNTLNWLRATVGALPGGEPALKVEPNNHIQAADLAINNRAHLELSTAIPRLRYQFSDSATIALSGAAARSLTPTK